MNKDFRLEERTVNTEKIPFNQPYLTGLEIEYVSAAIRGRKHSGDGDFTRRCHEWLQKLGFRKPFLTTSCTSALDMAALLLDIKAGDEVIVPSYTFVSTANAFALRGATVRLADSLAEQPNVDPAEVERLINDRTKVICVVHYAGVACDMDRILAAAQSVGASVVEDAAQAIFSSYQGRPLGSIGSFGAFSFHETKNISCGEGGFLAVNEARYDGLAEIVREKGTNRSAFFRGEVDKYGWVALGSSYLPSEILAAFLLAQFDKAEEIQQRRLRLWEIYRSRLADLAFAGAFTLPVIPSFATNNAHMFYLVCRNSDEQRGLISELKAEGISAVFHYQSLHASAYFNCKYDGQPLRNSDHYSDCLMRLPLFPELQDGQIDRVCEVIRRFYVGCI
ncbi:MAG: dTDP-4-amino-4,6-dideoxygalactose transaminase [Acidobacteriota bacterium]|nr:dTDP-4-amino-4,6-dideoxygalactose transaminase [Acidobacteriota bacterium]